MKELLLQLTILLLSVGFLWHFGLIKTTSDNEDMNLFLDLTVESWGPGWGDQISDSDGACSGCQPVEITIIKRVLSKSQVGGLSEVVLTLHC